MIQLPDMSKTIKFNLRSDEVIGSTIKTITDREGKSKRIELLGAILSSVSVFLMAIMVTTGKLSFLNMFIKNGGRDDNIYYISTKIDIPELVEEIHKYNNNISYMRTADFLLKLGNSHEKKEKCILALKSLLLIKHIAPLSKKVVIRNLMKLDNTITDSVVEKFNSITENLSDIIDFRNEVDNLSSESITKSSTNGST